MKKNSSRIVLLIVGLLIVAGLVIVGTVASVFAYRQFALSDRPTLSFEVSRSLSENQEPLVGKGVVVLNVEPDSPAAAAGLRRGSVILEVEGQEVNTPQELQQAIRQHDVGETISLTVLNVGEREEIEATLASRGPYLGVDVAGGPPASNRGQSRVLPELPPDFIPPGGEPGRGFPFGFPEEFDFEPFHLPAMIIAVVPGSPAEVSGLQPGDGIAKVDGQTVDGTDQVAELIGQKGPGDQIELTIQRGSQTLTVSVTLAAHPEHPDRGYLGVRLSPDRTLEEFFQERSG